MQQATPLHAIDFYLFRLFWSLSRVWFALLASLALISLVLGTIGYYHLTTLRNLSSSIADEFVSALQLFVLETPYYGRDLPLTLDLARHVAAIVSFSAVISLLGSVFFGQIQSSRLWILGRRHVILCGLGEKGATLVEELRRKLHFVVVIEPNPHHEDLASCRALGAITLIGSSTDAWQLKKARVDRAAVLLALFREDDRLNVETAVLAYEIHQSPRPGLLTCVLQITDVDMAAVVRKHDMATGDNDWFELELFNMFDGCARAMLRESVLGLSGVKSGRLLVVGLDRQGRLGEVLIVRAARDWHIENPGHNPRLVIDVVDLDANRKLAHLQASYPFLDAVCEIHAHDTAPDGPEFLRHDAWLRQGIRQVPGVAFVCLDDEAAALVAADRLRSLLPVAVPIIVQTIERDAGMGSLIRGRAFERVIAVGLKDRVFQIAASLHPTQELLAQAVHQEYVRHQQTQGVSSSPDKPAVQFWETLSEDYRAAGRAQARDLKRKLKLVGRKAVHVPDGLIDLESFTNGEVELLARDEHERWCAERKRQGWTYGPVRDNGTKSHPNLVPWEDPRFDEVTRDIDRNAIRRMPVVLAMADYRVVRVSTG